MQFSTKKNDSQHCHFHLLTGFKTFLKLHFKIHYDNIKLGDFKMIDIIIPAYNAHETIGKTIGSIAKQINRNDLTVYIVNDGSIKSYDYIIEQYKSLLKIKEITIENLGKFIYNTKRFLKT